MIQINQVAYPTVPLPLPLGGVSGAQLLLVIGNPMVHLLRGSPLLPLQPFFLRCSCVSFNVSWFLVSIKRLVPSLDVQSSSVAQIACWASVSPGRWAQIHTPWPCACEVWGEQKGAWGSKNSSISLYWNAGSAGGGAWSRSRTSFLHPAAAGHTCPVNPQPHPKDADRPSKNKYPSRPTELYLWMPSKCEESC